MEFCVIAAVGMIFDEEAFKSATETQKVCMTDMAKQVSRAKERARELLTNVSLFVGIGKIIRCRAKTARIGWKLAEVVEFQKSEVL